MGFSPRPGLTPEQDKKLDSVVQKLNTILECFANQNQVLGQLEEMKKNNPALDGVYLKINKVLQAARPAIEAVLKPAYEVVADQIKSRT